MSMEIFWRYSWGAIKISRTNMGYSISECIWLSIWKDEVGMLLHASQHNDNSILKMNKIT